MQVLAGDVGGTKTRLAVFDVDGTRLETVAEDRYTSAEFASLDAIVAQFIETHNVHCRAACFGIAGPVRGGCVRTTNLPWVVEADALAARFDFARASLINDLEANAWGIQALQPDDFHLVHAGVAAGGGNASIIAAGTGLGEAGLYWDGRRHWPFASEGGHADFSPRNDIEIALLRYLQQHYERVSWERVVSGMGLVNIHNFLRVHHQVETPEWLRAQMAESDAAAAISTAARTGRDPLCSEALDLFVHLYGVEAGNHALKIMATGGVYIGGGIAPKIHDKHKDAVFMEGFLDKGRMRPLMESMPVRIILNDHTALFGPALYLAAGAD